MRWVFLPIMLTNNCFYKVAKVTLDKKQDGKKNDEKTHWHANRSCSSTSRCRGAQTDDRCNIQLLNKENVSKILRSNKLKNLLCALLCKAGEMWYPQNDSQSEVGQTKELQDKKNLHSKDDIQRPQGNNAKPVNEERSLTWLIFHSSINEPFTQFNTTLTTCKTNIRSLKHYLRFSNFKTLKIKQCTRAYTLK